MKKKILICASTMSHIMNFHMPYIDNLKSDSNEYEVKIMATCDPGTKDDYNIKFEKKILSFSNFKNIKKIKEILEKEKFDIVFLNTTLASFFVRCAIKKMKNRPRVVNVVHGYFFSKKSKCFKNIFYLLAEKHVKKVTDTIIAMNDEDFLFAKKYKLARNNVFKIDGMGVDENRIYGKLHYKENNGQNYTFSFVGELSNRKNQKFLIDFISELKKKNINAKLNLIGFGDKKEELKNYAKKLKIENDINFIGYKRDFNPIFDETNFYISASKIEGLPFNIVEAMQSGQIVFASNVKGNCDLIRDFENGFLFELGDLKGLVEKFLIIKNDLSLQEKIRKQELIDVKRYQLKSVESKNMKLIKDIIEK